MGEGRGICHAWTEVFGGNVPAGARVRSPARTARILIHEEMRVRGESAQGRFACTVVPGEISQAGDGKCQTIGRRDVFPHAARGGKRRGASDKARPRWREPVRAVVLRSDSGRESGWHEASARRAHGGCLGVGGRGRTRPRGETPRGGAGGLGSGGVRMGQPARRTAAHPEQSGRQPRELKHLSTARRRDDSPSSGERTGRSPNPSGGTACRRCPVGVGRAERGARQRPRPGRGGQPKPAGTGRRRG